MQRLILITLFTVSWYWQSCLQGQGNTAAIPFNEPRLICLIQMALDSARPKLTRPFEGIPPTDSGLIACPVGNSIYVYRFRKDLGYRVTEQVKLDTTHFNVDLHWKTIQLPNPHLDSLITLYFYGREFARYSGAFDKRISDPVVIPYFHPLDGIKAVVYSDSEPGGGAGGRAGYELSFPDAGEGPQVKVASGVVTRVFLVGL